MKKLARQYRHKRILRKIKGGSARHRLVIFRSHKHIYAQLVDDANHKVVTGVSTLSAQFRETKLKPSNKEAAKQVGKLVAALAQKNEIISVSFDRGGYRFCGRVKSLAEGAREGGLKF